jgi:diamine N-acetyltransferase
MPGVLIRLRRMLVTRIAQRHELPEIAAIEAQPGTARWLGRTGMAWHEAAFADPQQQHLVMVDEYGTLAAFLVLAGLKNLERTTEIRRIVVAGNRRGAGVGRALLRFALDFTYTRHGARECWLDVKTGNAVARRLYTSEGFRELPPRAVSRRAIPVTRLPSGEPDPDLIVMLHVAPAPAAERIGTRT